MPIFAHYDTNTLPYETDIFAVTLLDDDKASG